MDVLTKSFDVEGRIAEVLAESGMSDYQKAVLLQSLATAYAFKAAGGYGSTTMGPCDEVSDQA